MSGEDREMTGKEVLLMLALAFGAGGIGFLVGHKAGRTHGRWERGAEVCRDIAGKSARYIEGRCYVASPDGSLVPAKGAK